MAFNIAPVYGKQFIRYAETWEAATDKQTAGVGAVELLEFAVVAQATYAGANKICSPGDLTTFAGKIVGVNQAYIPTALSQPFTARLASIATSGSLIVEKDPASTNAFTLNTQLAVSGTGRAIATGGTAVTLNGTTPLIREIVTTGGRTFLIVSFS